MHPPGEMGRIAERPAHRGAACREFVGALESEAERQRDQAPQRDVDCYDLEPVGPLLFSSPPYWRSLCFFLYRDHRWPPWRRPLGLTGPPCPTPAKVTTTSGADHEDFTKSGAGPSAASVPGKSQLQVEAGQ